MTDKEQELVEIKKAISKILNGLDNHIGLETEQ